MLCRGDGLHDELCMVASVARNRCKVYKKSPKPGQGCVLPSVQAALLQRKRGQFGFCYCSLSKWIPCPSWWCGDRKKKGTGADRSCCLAGVQASSGMGPGQTGISPPPLDVTLRYAKVNVSCQGSSDRRLQFSLCGSPGFCLWSLSLWEEAPVLVTGRE